MGDQSPMYSPFFGVMGATSAMVFSGKFDSCYNSYGLGLTFSLQLWELPTVQLSLVLVSQPWR